MELDESSFDQAASVKVALGSQVWVEDPDEAWLDGEVVEANGEEIKVNCQTKTVSPFYQKLIIDDLLDELLFE